MADNNYSELDKELARLKSELEIQDEMTSRFTAFSSAMPNYWQKRLAEEQELWKKRLLTREEEKKALEARIKKQDTMLEEYRQKLSEMEKTFERELKNWEERFRVKEADLLLEKNRLMWEEKIKDAESETRQLLEKVSALNETIARLKDENIADREKLQAQHTEEKRILDEKISSLESVIKELEEHLSRIKSTAAEEEEKLKHELSLRTEELEALSGARTALDAQKNALLKEIDNLTARLTEEKKIYENNLRELSARAAGILDEKMDYIRRIAEYRQRFNLAPSSKDVEIYSCAAHATMSKILNEASAVDTPTANIVAAVIGNSPRAKSVLAGMSRIPAVQCRLKDIPKIMPSVIIGDTLSVSIRAARKYPFIPTLCFSEPRISVKSEKLPPNLKILSSENPSASVMAIKEAEDLALRSFAHPEIWHTLVPGVLFFKNKFVLGTLVGLSAFVALAIVISAIFVKRPLGLFKNLLLLRNNLVMEFSVPYSMPTAVTLDGEKYLWSCDWQGGAIYQHALDENLTLKKISYFPNQTFSALSYHRGALYSANPWSKKIYKHLINENFSVEKEYSSAGISVGAIAFIPSRLETKNKGENGKPFINESAKPIIYLADAQSPRIVSGYLDDEKKSFIIVKEFPLDLPSGGTIAGLWCDGKYLWACAALSNYVYKYRLNDDLSVEGVYILPESYRKNFRISGFSGGKGYRFWISSERMGKIISIPYSKLARFDNGAK